MRRLVPFLVFCVLCVLYGTTTSPDPSPDARTAELAARHIALSGDPVPDIASFPYLDDNIIRETWIVETTDGREAVGRAPGVIAAIVPAYALARPGWVDPLPGGLTAAGLTALAMVLLLLALRDHLGHRRALVAVAVVALATPAWSVSADAVWPHTLTTLGITGAAWAADRRRWWLVGLFGGVMLWGRLHAAVVCAVLGLGLALSRRRPAVAVRVGAASMAALGLSAAWTRWMYGSWDPTSAYRAGDFTGTVADRLVDPLNWLGFLVSADRGLLWWAPLLLVLAPTAWRCRRDLPDWSRWLALGGVAYTATQAVLNRFSGGDHFYGYRTSLELVVCLAPALALAAPRLSERALRWCAPVAVVQVVVIATGAVSDDLYSPVRDVWWRHAFVDAVLTRPEDVLPVVAATVAITLVGAILLVDPRVVTRLERLDRDGPRPAPDLPSSTRISRRTGRPHCAAAPAAPRAPTARRPRRVRTSA